MKPAPTKSLLAWVVLVLSSSVRVASAETPPDDDRRRAGELFRAAQAAHRSGDPIAAARAFEEAHALVPSGSALYNAGRSWEAGGRPAEAADAYALALVQVDFAGENRQHAEKRLSALRGTLVAVGVSGPPGLRAGRPQGALRAVPTTVHVSPGTSAVVLVRPDGRKEERPVEGQAGQETRIVVEADPPPAPVPPPPPVIVAPVAEPAPAAPARQPRWLGWTGVAVAAGATTAAIVFGSGTMAALKEFEDSEYTSKQAHDRAIGLRNLTNLSWLVAIGGVGVAIYGFVRDEEPDKERTALVVGPGVLGVRGRF